MPTLHADTFFKLSNDLLCVEGLDGFFKDVNPALRKLLGYPENILLSTPILAFVHPADVDKTQRFLDSAQGEAYENRLKCANGEYKWLSWTRTICAEEELILSSARDVTQEKLLEKGLEKTVAENQRLLDSSLDIICTLNRQGNFLSVSKACEVLLGYRQEELLGRHYSEFVYHPDTVKNQQAEAKLFNGEGVVNFENQYIRKDGTLIPLSWSARWAEESQIIYSIARDVTLKKQQEEMLALSEQRFRSLVYSGSDLISVISAEGVYLYLSPSFELLGYSDNALAGKSPFDYIHPDDLGRVQEAFQAILRNERIEVEPFRFKEASGIYRWIKSTALNRLNDPAVQGIITNSCDVTESLKLERERESALDRVQNLINNFTEGYIVVDREYCVVDYNQKAHEIIGRDLVVKGRSLCEIFPLTERMQCFHQYEKAFAEHQNVHFIDYYPAFQHWLEVSAYPYQNNLTIFFKDITEAKIKEMNLKLEKDVLKMNTDSQFSLKSILDHYLSGLSQIYPEQRLAVSLVDKKGLLLSPISSPALPGFYNLFSNGFSIEPIEGTCRGAAFYKRMTGIGNVDVSVLDPLFRQFAIDNEVRAVWSFPITNENDKVLATVSAFYASPKILSEQEEEQIKRIITFIQILIESHQVREFLEMSIERYKLVTQSAKDAIYDWDITGDEVSWGEGMEKAFGHVDHTTSIKWWESKVHPEDLPGVNESLWTFLADPEQSCWNANYRFLQSNGSYAYIVENGFVIRNSQGKALRLVGAMQDHTAVIEKQVQILKQNNTLKEIARINSHYIRKPLANILALIEAIKTSETEDLKELIDMLELSGLELDEITRQIARKAYF